MNKMHMAALAGIAAIAACGDNLMAAPDRPRDTTPRYYDRPNPNATSKDSGKVRAHKVRKRRS